VAGREAAYPPSGQRGGGGSPQELLVLSYPWLRLPAGGKIELTARLREAKLGQELPELELGLGAGCLGPERPGLKGPQEL